MRKQEDLFYEDNTGRKKYFLAFTILFYAGALIGICGMIVFSLIIPAESLAHYDFNAEHYFALAFLLVVGTLFMFLAVKEKRLNYYVAITEKEITFNEKGKLQKYNNCDLIRYEFVGKKRKATEFKVLFIDEKAISITTNKAQELKTILDKIMFDKQKN